MGLSKEYETITISFYNEGNRFWIDVEEYVPFIQILSFKTFLIIMV